MVLTTPRSLVTVAGLAVIGAVLATWSTSWVLAVVADGDAVEVGWPAPSLAYSYMRISSDGGYELVDCAWVLSEEHPFRSGRRLELPFHPVWPGFLIDTVLFAMLLFGVIAIPSLIVARTRVLRCRCPSPGSSVIRRSRSRSR